MGGMPPLGYDVKDRQLAVNPEEARTGEIALVDRHDSCKVLLELANGYRLELSPDRLAESAIFDILHSVGQSDLRV